MALTACSLSRPALRVARALCALLLAVVACCAAAQAVGLARESAVKAAFLYKFGSFVEWPPGTFRSPSSPFVIADYGDEAVASELEQITAGRSVDGHPVQVKRIRDPEEVGTPQVLFAGGVRERRVREVLAAARGPVLTVSDGPLAGQPGPVLFFLREEGRVRFGASLTAASKRGLRLSARLLAVAQEVEGR
jgi:hypothetical protein